MTVLKSAIRIVLGLLFFYSGVYRIRLRKAALVVLFHRVDDRWIDKPITVSMSRFDQYCRFFRRFFQPISLAELLTRLKEGRDVSGNLVVTFDDGYRDNYWLAAPILKRHGMSGCFFVTTDYIGTEYTPPWDSANGVRSQWMTWQQVRLLKEEGFEIGAHTLTHANLGEVEGEDAVREICESGKKLSAVLAISDLPFAYPFGGPDKLTADNWQRVRAAGYVCCASAFGGLVRPGADAFRLLRVNINNISPYEFAYYLVVEEARR